jgi:hypothetical protein
MRCLSYRLIKIDRIFTGAYLLCDKASLAMDYGYEDEVFFSFCYLGVNA